MLHTINKKPRPNNDQNIWLPQGTATIDSHINNQDHVNGHGNEQLDNDTERNTANIVASFHKNETNIFGGVVDPEPKTSVVSDKRDQPNQPITQLSNQQITQQSNQLNQQYSYQTTKFMPDKSTNSILINDQRGQTVGQFGIADIVKYLSICDDKNHQFMKEIDLVKYEASKLNIKKFLFKILYNKTSDHIDIVLIDDSELINDIEIMMYLNKMMETYMKTTFQSDLADVDQGYRGNIERNVNKLYYMLMNHTVKQIRLGVDTIINDGTKIKLKDNMIRYEIQTIKSIVEFVEQENRRVQLDNIEIMKKLEQNNIIKSEINGKLDQILQRMK